MIAESCASGPALAAMAAAAAAAAPFSKYPPPAAALQNVVKHPTHPGARAAMYRPQQRRPGRCAATPDFNSDSHFLNNGHFGQRVFANAFLKRRFDGFFVGAPLLPRLSDVHGVLLQQLQLRLSRMPNF